MAPDYYNQDPEDKGSYQKTVALCVAAASLVILLFLVVLYVNSDKGTDTRPVAKTEKTEEEPEEDFLKDSHNITSTELEFWEDAKKEKRIQPKEEEGELTPYKYGDENSDDIGLSDTSKNSSSTDEMSSSSSSTEKRDRLEEGEGSLNKDGADDFKERDGYITITDDKGKKTSYEIIEDVPKNDYDLSNNLINENGMLSYRDNRREAIKGADLSKYNGSVDFAKLKEAGIGFVMLRLGSRGYGTGKIDLDERFVEYAQNAQLNGIQTGAYFYSQAINEAEAIEEANYIVGAVSGFKIKYPIAIDIEKVSGDEARTDKLTSAERTAVVKAFCDAVKGYGYKPIIYASKEMLIGSLNLEELTDYDVWLQDYDSPTNYPYRFAMWQYSRTGKIDGITGDIDLDLCFINYEQK
ncbi:MAG: glycoside hydrolase family 25 protein [Lachnospiraceae bacterium]|nr:glycoside hydrolase family 25 protein [Lachnospiraceae bacterium]